jgi:hypothetical protein
LIAQAAMANELTVTVMTIVRRRHLALLHIF